MVTYPDVEAEYNLVNLNYPGLDTFVEKDGAFCISGNIPIVDGNDHVWATYQIEIWIRNTYPETLPLLREIGRDIERHNDWHINEVGLCCVGTEARQFRDLATNFSICNWINMFVVPYLANHVHKVQNDHYVDGELAHGVEGLYQDYASLFNLENQTGVIARLKRILGRKRLPLNGSCFCGSGKKYKRCFLINRVSHCMGIPLRILPKRFKLVD